MYNSFSNERKPIVLSLNFKTDLIKAPLAISDVKTFCEIFKDQNNFNQLLGINSIKDERT
jgi:hypothetical protein